MPVRDRPEAISPTCSPSPWGPSPPGSPPARGRQPRLRSLPIPPYHLPGDVPRGMGLVCSLPRGYSTRIGGMGIVRRLDGGVRGDGVTHGIGLTVGTVHVICDGIALIPMRTVPTVFLPSFHCRLSSSCFMRWRWRWGRRIINCIPTHSTI